MAANLVLSGAEVCVPMGGSGHRGWASGACPAVFRWQSVVGGAGGLCGVPRPRAAALSMLALGEGGGGGATSAGGSRGPGAERESASAGRGGYRSGGAAIAPALSPVCVR